MTVSFRPYLLGAMVFALVLTALAANDHIAKLIGQSDLLVFVPIMTAVLLSGNAHMPSDFGVYLGFFIEWFVVGLGIGALVWVIRKRNAEAAP